MDARGVCRRREQRRLKVIGFVLPHLQSQSRNDDEDENDDAMKTLLAELILATKNKRKDSIIGVRTLGGHSAYGKSASGRGAISDGQVGNRAGVAAWLAQSDYVDKDKKEKNKNGSGDDDVSDDDDDET